MKGLIQQRLKVLRKIDISVLRFNEHNAQIESLKRWGESQEGELRNDTTNYPKKSPFINFTQFIP